MNGGHVRRITTVAVMAAASVVAMMTIQFPVLPGAPYLKYDPSDVVALVVGFSMGPGAGVLTVLLKDVLFWLIRGSDPFGPLADFIAAASFVGASAWVFGRLAPYGEGRPSPGSGTLLPARASPLPAMALAVVVGVVVRVATMAVANFPILYLEFGMPPHKVAALLWPAIIPFNAVKGLLNGTFAVVLAGALVRRNAVVAPWR